MTIQPAAELVKIFRLVKSNFNFTKDRGLEDWQMPPSGYDGKQTISDDCDGFCLACRKLLRERGILSRLVYCEFEERGRTQGHLVVEVNGWILDNRQESVIANTGLSDYRWLRISGYEPGEHWREIISLT